MKLPLFALSGAGALLVGAASAQDLPPLSNNLCSYDTIYDQIKTGNVVEVTLQVRHRNCPANRNNKPCNAENAQGFAPGPLLDGVQASDAIVINDAMPGPTIRANLGDTIKVNVVNLLHEPTTMHFHGMTQFRTPFMDGDEMISNCPIAMGYSHTYEFIAHPAGSTFYHSHSGSQRIAGMTGPLIVEDPDEPYADEDDAVVFLQDWFHDSSDTNFEFWAQNTAPNCVTFGGNYFGGIMNDNGIGPVVGDGYLFESYIVNGQGMYDYHGTQINATWDGSTFPEKQCPGQTLTPPRCEYCLNPDTWSAELCTTSSGESICGAPAVIEVEAGKETRLRFIHAGALFASQTCIDAHSVDLITADGSAIEPYTTDCFIINPAERYDAMIAPTAPGDYWIRFTTLEQQPTADSGTPDTIYAGFPHQGHAILRVTGSAEDTISYLSDTSPVACDEAITTNCGENYWLTSTTMGCSPVVSMDDPDRCTSIFDALIPASSPNSDASLCGDELMAHQVDATVKATVGLSFLPDENPRWEGYGLNTRMELMTEEEWGYPYFDPADKAEWEAHYPVSFINPPGPTLSLSPEQREEIYSQRTTVRASDPNNPGELYPNYPEGFSSVTSGVNALSVEYGDVVRILLRCDKSGPGCAMPHPMHLHGNKMAILYMGKFDEPYDESKFTSTPLYRDTITIMTDSYVVVQIAATNPGAWRWHCHVNIHHRSGMAMLIDVGGDEAVEAVRATPESANLCPEQPDIEEEASDETPTDGAAPVPQPSEDGSGTEPSGSASSAVVSGLVAVFTLAFAVILSA